MRCKNCGFEMNVGEMNIKFCPACGTPFGESAQNGAQSPIETNDGLNTADIVGAEETSEVSNLIDEGQEIIDALNEVDAELSTADSDGAEQIVVNVQDGEVVVEKKPDIKPIGKRTLAQQAAALLAKSYHDAMAKDYVDAVWDNADSRFISIDKSYAPELFSNDDKVADASDYTHNLSEYNQRIKRELGSIKPRLDAVEKNRRERDRVEWEGKVKVVKRKSNIKNYVAVIVSFACLLVALLMNFIIKDSYRNVPFVEIVAASLGIAFLFMVVTVTVFNALRRKKHSLSLVLKIFGFLFAMVPVALFITLIALEVQFALNFEVAHIDWVLFALNFVMGLSFGIGAGLTVRALGKSIIRSRYYKKIVATEGDADTLKIMKKRSTVFLVAVIILSVIFAGANIASRVMINYNTAPFYYDGIFMSTDGATLNGISEDYINGHNITQYNVPDRFTTIGKAFLPEKNSILSLTFGSGTKFKEGALSTAQSVVTLTLPMDDGITLDYLFAGKIPQSLNRVNLVGADIEIPQNAFKGASNLQTVAIASSSYGRLISVGKDAFTGTKMLENAIIRSGVKYVNISGDNIAVIADAMADNIVIAGDTDMLAEGVFGPLMGKVVKSISLPFFGLGWRGSYVSDETVNLSMRGYFGGDLQTRSYYADVERLEYQAYDCPNFSGLKVREYDYLIASGSGYMLSAAFGNSVQYINTVTVTANSGSVGLIGGSFSDCSALNAVYIQGNITTIGSNVMPYGREIDVFFSGSEDYYNFSYNWAEGAYVTTTFNCSRDNDVKEIDGARYLISKADMTAKLIRYTGTSPQFTVPSEIRSDGITYSVSEIGEKAFAENNNIVSVEISDGIEIIGDSAFADCTRLTYVFIGSDVNTIGDYAFTNTAIEHITIPENVVNVGQRLFNRSTKDVYVYTTLASRPNTWNYSWNSTTSSISVNVLWNSEVGEQDGYTYISEIGSQEVAIIRYFGSETAVSVPETLGGKVVTEIKSGAFAGCIAVKSLYIPDCVEKIGDGVFADCRFEELNVPFIGGNSIANTGFEYYFNTGGGTVTIPASLHKVTVRGGRIINGAFSDVTTAITDVVLEEGVTEISQGALRGLNTLSDLTIPYIGTSGLPYICSLFGGVSVEDNVTAVPSSLIKVTVLGGDIGEQTFGLNKSISTVILGDSVSSIGSEAFAETGLIEIEIGSGVNSIDQYAFAESAKLLRVRNLSGIDLNGYFENDVEILTDRESEFGGELSTDENGITWYRNDNAVVLLGYSGASRVLDLSDKYISSIHASAFNANSIITTVILPDWSMTIGKYAFYGCSNLRTLYLPSRVREIGNNAFRNCNNLTIYTDVIGPEDEAPAVWGNGWNSERPVIYGCKGVVYEDEGLFIVSNESAKLIKFTGNSASYYTVPMTVQGLPVVAIGANAFDGSDLIVDYVAIHSGIASIDANAFVNFDPSFRDVKLLIYRDTVTSGYEENWSGNCTVINGFEGITSDTGIDYLMFENVAYLYRFNNPSVTDVLLPSMINGKMVTTICTGAFDNESSLTTVRIPAAVRFVEHSAFIACHPDFKIFAAHQSQPAGWSGDFVNGDIPFSIEWGGIGKFQTGDFDIASGTSKTLSVAGTDVLRFEYDASWAYSSGSIISTNKSDNSTSVFRVEVLANCSFGFTYNVSSESGYDHFILTKNGQEIIKQSGSRSGVQTYELQSGDILEFKYSKDSSQASGRDDVMISEVNVLVRSMVNGVETSSEIIDNQDMWSNGGNPIIAVNGVVLFGVENNGYWEQREDYVNDGDSTEYRKYWKSTNNGRHGTDAQLNLTAYYDCTVTIIYRVSSEGSCDVGSVRVNGSSVAQDSGNNTQNKTATATLNQGDVLSLVYHKDGSVDSYDDAMFIYSVIVEYEI